jgi:hypothetical protein
MFPDTRPLARRILELMDRAAAAITMPMMQPEGGEDEEGSGDSGDGDNDGSGDVDRGRVMVRRYIQQEGPQFCVYSETGRAFGCYTTLEQAQARLAQIESFAEATLLAASADMLIEFHDASHKVAVVTPAVKEIHDLISDEIEVVHGIAEPYALPNVVKQAMLSRMDAGFVSKAAEYKYTLGPAYVPMREDAHGEFTDTVTLQTALWDWVRKGDRTIYLQHSDKAAGEMVEMMTLPFPLEAELSVPGQGVTKYTFPADTPFLGVIWEDWAWEMVKAGQLRGYSIGGTAKRVEAELPDYASI